MEENVIFDTTTFPNINVTINSMNNDKEYDLFINKWKELYDTYNKNFNLFIDTKNLTLNNVSLLNAYKIPVFINYLKKNKPKFLIKTIIYVYSKSILNIFKMIFKIQKPISNVYIILNTEDIKSNKTYFFKNE